MRRISSFRLPHCTFRVLMLAALIAGALIGVGAAQAQDLNRYFDSASSGTTWDNNTTANWGSVSGGPYTITYGGAYNRPWFEGTGGTINVSGTVTANAIQFTANGYVLNGGAISKGSPTGGPVFNVASGVTATINSTIATTTYGFNKTGAGTLELGGNVTYSSANVDSNYWLKLDNGTLRIIGGTSSNPAFMVLGSVIDGTTQTFTQTGGMLNQTAAIFVGNGNGGGASVLNFTGGTFNASGQSVAFAERDAATLNVSGTALVTLGAVTGTGQAGVASRAAIINLDGGTLAATSFTNVGTNGGTFTFNFNGGTLRATAASTLMSGLTAANVQSGGAAIDSNGFAVTISQALLDGGGGGGLTKSGANTLTLTGANTYTGATSVSNGTLQVGSGGTTGSLSSSSAISIGGSGTVRYNRNDSASEFTIANAISGTGTLAFTNTSGGTTAGRYSLTGNNSSFSGPLTISSSRVLASATNHLGTAPITVNAVGQLFVNSASTFSNSLTLNSTGWVETDGNFGALRLAGGANWSGGVTLASTSAIGNFTGESGTISGVISDGGSGFGLTKTSGGTIALGGASSNTYTGTTTLTGTGMLGLSKTGGAVAVPGNVTLSATGTRTILYATQDNQFGSGSVLSFNGGLDNRFELKGTTQTVAGINSTGTANYFIQHTEFSPGAVASGTSTLILNGSGTYSYAGVIRDFSGGSMKLTKTGNGTQTLSGANTYTGGTTVNQGTLALQSTYAPSSSFSIDAGAVLELNVASGTRDYSSATFSGGGTLRKTGNGTAQWGLGVATFALNVGAASLIDVQGGQLTGGSNANENWTNNKASLNIALGAIFDGVEANVRVDALTGNGIFKGGHSSTGYVADTIGVNGGSGTFFGTIQDSFAPLNLVKTGIGTQTLSGANTYTGTTTVNAGILKISGAVGNTTTGDTYVYGGELHLDKSFGNAVNDANLSTLWILGGAVKLFGSNQMGNGGGVNIDTAGGVLNMQTHSDTIYQLFTVADTTVTGESGSNLTVGSGGGSVDGLLTGGLGLTKAVSDVLVLNNANTHTGDTLVAGGTLSLGHFDALQNSTLDTGTAGAQEVGFTAGAGTYNLGGLKGADALGNNVTGIGANTVSVGANGQSTTFSGDIIGATGGLTKTGVGTLELTGANTYSGATIIDSGTLWLNGTAGFSHSGAGAYVVGNGGTLKGDGNLEDHAITFATGSTGAPGNSPGLMPAGSQSWDDNSTYEWEVAQAGAAGVDYDTYAVSGLLDFSAISGTMTLELIKWPGGSIALTDTFALWTYGALTGWDAPDNVAFGKFTLVSPNNSVNYSSAYVYNDGAGTIWLTGIYVPEPSTLVLMALSGLLGLGFIGWRKRLHRG